MAASAPAFWTSIRGAQSQELLESSVALQLDILDGKRVKLDDPGAAVAAVTELSAAERAARAEAHLFGSDELSDDELSDPLAPLDGHRRRPEVHEQHPDLSAIVRDQLALAQLPTGAAVIAEQ